MNDEFGTWNNINRVPKFFIFDARTPFLMVAVIYFPSWSTAGAVLVAMLASAYANYKGVSIPHLMRFLRVTLWRGRKMIARPRWRARVRVR